RWIEYLSQFDYEIVHVQGTTNRVADSFSRYFAEEGADMLHDPQDYVSADIRLDPRGETLSGNRMAEIRAQRIIEPVEQRVQEATELAAHHPTDVLQTSAGTGEDPTALDSEVAGPPLDVIVERIVDFKATVKDGYKDDMFFAKVLEHSDDHKAFAVQDGFIWHC
ncbi:hypothetical protein BKA93DRAFT_701155, partial [Sparassis latifolia]